MSRKASQITTYRTLRQMDSRRPHQVPLLPAKNRNQRLQWAIGQLKTGNMWPGLLPIFNCPVLMTVDRCGWKSQDISSFWNTRTSRSSTNSHAMVKVTEVRLTCICTILCVALHQAMSRCTGECTVPTCSNMTCLIKGFFSPFSKRHSGLHTFPISLYFFLLLIFLSVFGTFLV